MSQSQPKISFFLARNFFVLSLISLCTGCGENIFIAKKMRFHVVFQEATAELNIDLDPQYKIDLTQAYAFEELGSLKIDSNTEFQSNTVSTLLHADPINLALSWPVSNINRFPNGEKLPSSLNSGNLKQWMMNQSSISLGFLYQTTPDLILGGAILSDQFKSLPINFLATQKFYGANGKTIGSVSIMGPTKNTKGGLFYLGNLGSNPFITSDRMGSISASEPLQIISSGKGRFPFPLDFQQMLTGVTYDLQSFRETPIFPDHSSRE